LAASLPGTEVFYTLKANLAPEVLSLLIKLGFKLRCGETGCPYP
jgi:diaminopimelate decarboxylase